MSALEGRTAIVTGAAGGIGRESALAMGRAGAATVVVDLDEEGGRETVAYLDKEGSAASFFRADVTRADEVASMVEHAIVVPSRDTQRIQEALLAIEHILCDLVETELFG